MVTICLLRHGETAFNAEGNRYCGRTDVGLTDKGEEQAWRMRELLKDYTFAAVFSSPLKRAKMTAEIACGIPALVSIDKRLIEVDFGQWEGKRAEEFQLEDPESWKKWSEDPLHNAAGRTGETGKDVVTRLSSFYEEITERYEGKTILVVGHNGINRLFLASQLGMPLKNYRRLVQENSALTLLTLSKEKGCSLLKLNA